MNRAALRVFLQGWFCGCGSPGDASKSLLRLLELHPLYDHRAEFEAWIRDEGVRHLVLYAIDHRGLAEHGSSVGGQWLTAKGEAVLAALRIESLDNFEALHAQHCVHGIDLGQECPGCVAGI